MSRVELGNVPVKPFKWQSTLFHQTFSTMFDTTHCIDPIKIFCLYNQPICWHGKAEGRLPIVTCPA